MQQAATAPSTSTSAVLRLLTAAAAVGMAATIWLPWLGYSGSGGNDITLYDLAFKGDYNHGMLTSTGVMLAALAGVLLSCIAGGASGRAEAAWARARGAFFGAALMPAVDSFFTDKIAGLSGLDLKSGVWFGMIAAAVGIGLAAFSTMAADMDDGGPAASHASGVFFGLAFGIIITLWGVALLEIVRQTYGVGLISSSDKADAYKLVFSDAGVTAAAAALPSALWLLRLMSRASAYPAYGSAPSYGRASPAPYGVVYQEPPQPSSPSPAYVPAAYAPPQPVGAARLPEPYATSRPDAPPAAGGAAVSPASLPAADSTPVAPLPPAPLAPRTVRARYNGVIIWQDWRRREVQLDRVGTGTPMTVHGEADGFLDVELPSGMRGFVAAGAVEPDR